MRKERRAHELSETQDLDAIRQPGCPRHLDRGKLRRRDERAAQVGAVEVGAADVRHVEVRPTQVGMTEVGVDQVDGVEISADQTGVVQVGVRQVGDGKLRPHQVGIGQRQPAQIRTVERQHRRRRWEVGHHVRADQPRLVEKLDRQSFVLAVELAQRGEEMRTRQRVDGVTLRRRVQAVMTDQVGDRVEQFVQNCLLHD